MAVPNTNTFTLIDVKNEIESNGGGTVTSLTSAFTNANSSGFDPNYVGSKDRLSNFRNYEHVPFTPTLVISPTSESVGSDPGTFNITITSNVSWTISSSVGWMTPSVSSGSGNDVVTITFTENTSGTSGRSGEITVETLTGITRTCDVTQTAAAPTYYSAQLRGPYPGSAQACSGSGLSTFWLKDSPNITLATGVYLDSNGNQMAGNGWYTNGTVAREQTNLGLTGLGQTC